MSRHTFAVGRLNPATREVQFVEPCAAPLPGPWSLKAVVGAGSANQSVGRSTPVRGPRRRHERLERT
jgi:hypothetical protein